jgi:type IV secretory pathway component VirB8
MEKEILDLVKQQDLKINEIYRSVEKTRKYILYMTIISVAFVVLPIVGLLFVVPSFISGYTELLGGF